MPGLIYLSNSVTDKMIAGKLEHFQMALSGIYIACAVYYLMFGLAAILNNQKLHNYILADNHKSHDQWWSFTKSYLSQGHGGH